MKIVEIPEETGVTNSVCAKRSRRERCNDRGQEFLEITQNELSNFN